jgi:hypothetical protein
MHFFGQICSIFLAIITVVCSYSMDDVPNELKVPDWGIDPHAPHVWSGHWEDSRFPGCQRIIKPDRIPGQPRVLLMGTDNQYVQAWRMAFKNGMSKKYLVEPQAKHCVHDLEYDLSWQPLIGHLHGDNERISIDYFPWGEGEQFGTYNHAEDKIVWDDGTEWKRLGKDQHHPDRIIWI